MVVFLLFSFVKFHFCHISSEVFLLLYIFLFIWPLQHCQGHIGPSVVLFALQGDDILPRKNDTSVISSTLGLQVLSSSSLSFAKEIVASLLSDYCGMTVHTKFIVFHLQNTPNDLQLLSDAPAHHIFCLLGPVDPAQNTLPEVYCVLQVRACKARYNKYEKGHVTNLICIPARDCAGPCSM